LNFGVLRSVRVISPALTDEIIFEIKHLLRQLRLRGLAEFAFYLAAEQTQEVLMTSFWWQMQDLQEANEALNLALSQKLRGRAELLESYIFQMIWDYRRFPVPTQSSVVRLLTLPDGYPNENVNKNIRATRRFVEKRPDVLAAWIGRTPNEGKYILYRTDWASIEAQQAYFKAEPVQQAILAYRASNIILNYASFTLQSIIKPEE